MHQRAGERHALALAARQPRRPFPRALGQAHLREHLGGLRTLCPGQPERDVVEHGLPRQQAGVLEHHARVVVQAVSGIAVAAQAAAVDALQPGDQPQQRALAAAAAPDDDDKLARHDLQVDAVQHLAPAVALDHAVDVQRGAMVFHAFQRGVFGDIALHGVRSPQAA